MRQAMRFDNTIKIIMLTGMVFCFMSSAQAQISGFAVPKFQDSLVIPPAMPMTDHRTASNGKAADYYEIAVRQFSQQILPSPTYNPTTVWSYCSLTNPSGTINYPAFTIEATVDKPVIVKWVNQLVDANNNYLPHLLPVDQTLHWANPPGGVSARDMHTANPNAYTGPVPICTHVHGAHVAQESDGYPEAWFLPDARNIPSTYATVGTYYDIYKKTSPHGKLWGKGNAVFEYLNDQLASTLWYHDHALGMTRLNVYAGPAGFYLIRGGDSDVVLTTAGNVAVLPGPAPTTDTTPGQRIYEIPIAIQDRMFNNDGSLFYPSSRTYFDGFAGPYIPTSDMSPIWNPEFFGNTIVVNGKTWPYLEVEKRRYRFRFLNGCQSRTLILTTAPSIPMWQIGAEGGFLHDPVNQTQILMSLAERADVIMDFSLSPTGNIELRNLGPDGPFQGGVPGVDFTSASTGSTGLVMQFRVVDRIGDDLSTTPTTMVLPCPLPLGIEDNTRQVSLNELSSDILPGVGPRQAALGTLMLHVTTTDMQVMPMGMPMMWMDTVTENPLYNSTEIWEIYNFTMDAHPIHLHLITFEVVNREIFMGTSSGTIMPPEAWESGFKDTVIAYPGQITRIKARFDKVGLYVWHCHIVEHEDNEMMRPYVVRPVILTDANVPNGI